MTPVLSRAQMRAFESHAIRTCNVPSLVLMENAGRGAADVLVRECLAGDARGARVVVVCGTGNNGGDGLVVARQLLVRGAEPVAFLAGDASRVSADARVNLEAWRGLGGDLRELASGAAVAPLEEAMRGASVVVDALFGTGLDRPVAGWIAGLVRAMNASHAQRFAVDLPSGLDADTGTSLGAAVEARVTATFAHYKLGLLTPRGAALAGRTHVVDIGVPPSLVDRAGIEVAAQRLDESDLARWIQPRAPGVHKTSAGHVVAMAGSAGKVGAALLVTRGAMRAGAGLATIATWPEAAAAIETRVLEAMTARIDPSRIGESLDAILAGKKALVVGPGFGLGDESRAAVDHALASFRNTIVVDADALTMFAGRAEALRAAKRAILTPHPGECARLLEKPAADIEADRFRAARDLVERTGAVVVLKGAHTIVASPSDVAVSPVACPALATAGSGDVLGGVVAAMACALEPFEAACAGVMLHALAGEAGARAIDGGADRGLLASEVADRVAHVLARDAGG